MLLSRSPMIPRLLKPKWTLCSHFVELPLIVTSLVPCLKINKKLSSLALTTHSLGSPLISSWVNSLWESSHSPAHFFQTCGLKFCLCQEIENLSFTSYLFCECQKSKYPNFCDIFVWEASKQLKLQMCKVDPDITIYLRSKIWSHS